MRGAGVLLLLIAAALAPAAAYSAAGTAPAEKPTVRAITAFVELDPARYAQQFLDTARQLHTAAGLFERAGFMVQTVRITTQPFAEYTAALPRKRAVALLRELATLAEHEHVMLNIGPAVRDDNPDPRALELLEVAQTQGPAISASMFVAGADGVHWRAVRAAAHHVALLAARSAGGEATFGFAATAMLEPGSPFFPGSWHEGQGGRFSVGLQSAGIATRVLARVPHDVPAAIGALGAALDAAAREVETVAGEVQAQTGLRYWGLDPTPAPAPAASIAEALEAFMGAPVGSAGTLTAAYVITAAQRQMRATRVGYSGLMLPVMEDPRLGQRWSEGAIHLDSLLAYSAVCGTGLDAMPLPGDVTEDELARIIGDVATLAYKWHKPLTARLQPVPRRKAGEMSGFKDPRLVNVRLQAVR